MKFLNKIKDALIREDQIPNPLGIPQPSNFSRLVFGTPEEIVKQFVSMQTKTQDLFQYANSTNSISDYCNALMRYSAYSSAAIYGVNLFVTNDKLGVETLVPERLNRLLYGKFLFDVADFGWLMLNFVSIHFDMTKKFGEAEVQEFLKKDHIPEFYWTLLFSFIVETENAEFAYKCLKDKIEKLEYLEPEKLENLPSIATRQAFDDMVKVKLIGDPNTWQLFNAAHIIQVMSSGPQAISDHVYDLKTASIVKSLEPEIRLHLLSSW